MRVLQKALTFDDVLLVPAHSAILPREVSLSTQLTRTISLNLPLLSAAMDTVTEARLAIALAQEGGIGIIHKNMNTEMQAAQVAAVKRFESGVVKDPDYRGTANDRAPGSGDHTQQTHFRPAGDRRRQGGGHCHQS